MQILIPNPNSGSEIIAKAQQDVIAWLSHHDCPAPDVSYWTQTTELDIYRPSKEIAVAITRSEAGVKIRTLHFPEGATLPYSTLFESNYRHIIYGLSPSYGARDPFFAERLPVPFVYTYSAGITDCLGGEPCEVLWLQDVTYMQFRVDRTSSMALMRRGVAMRDAIHMQFYFTDRAKFEHYAKLAADGNFEGAIELGAVPLRDENSDEITWDFPEFKVEIPEGVVTWM